MTDAFATAALPRLLTQHPLVEKLGTVLLHFLWEGALVAGGLALALVLLRRRPPAERYAASSAALLLMAALPVVTWQVLPPASPFASSVAAGPAAPRPDTPPALQGAVPLRTAPATPEEAGGDGEAAPAPALAKEIGRWVDRGAALAALAWLAGVVVLALRAMGGWGYLVHVRRRAAAPATSWQERFQALVREMGLAGGPRPPRLRVSARGHGPAVVGGWRPVVLVPAGMLTGMPPAQVEAILRHELAHVHRHDYLAGLVQAAVETLLFYHPAVWWVSGRVRTLREHCCDDQVARAGGGRLVYARALAALADWRSTPPLAPAGAGGALLARIRRLTGQHRAAEPSVGGLTAAALGALLVLGACAAGAVSHGGEGERPLTETSEPAPPTTPAQDSAASASPAGRPAPVAARRDTPPASPPPQAAAVGRDTLRSLADSLRDAPDEDAWQAWAEQWEAWGERWQEQWKEEAPAWQAWAEQWSDWGDSLRVAPPPGMPGSLRVAFPKAPPPAMPDLPQGLLENIPAPAMLDSVRGRLARLDTLPQVYYVRDGEPRFFQVDSLRGAVAIDRDSLIDEDDIASIEVIEGDSLRALTEGEAFPEGFDPEAMVRIVPKGQAARSGRRATEARRRPERHALERAADRLDARADSLETEGREEAARALREESRRLRAEDDEEMQSIK